VPVTRPSRSSNCAVPGAAGACARSLGCSGVKYRGVAGSLLESSAHPASGRAQSASAQVRRYASRPARAHPAFSRRPRRTAAICFMGNPRDPSRGSPCSQRTTDASLQESCAVRRARWLGVGLPVLPRVWLPCTSLTGAGAARRAAARPWGMGVPRPRAWRDRPRGGAPASRARACPGCLLRHRVPPLERAPRSSWAFPRAMKRPVSTDRSECAVRVIQTDEESIIARQRGLRLWRLIALQPACRPRTGGGPSPMSAPGGPSCCERCSLAADPAGAVWSRGSFMGAPVAVEASIERAPVEAE
jgi:hypothetical protein